MKDFYNNEWVWVTGASSGIGRELAKQCFDLGANVFLASRNTTELQKLVKELGIPKNRYAIEKLDLEDYKKLNKLVNVWLKKYPIPKVVIHNGGISQRSLTKETNLLTLERIMNTNFYGACEITRSLLPKVVDKKPIHFAVISSVAGKLGSPLRSAYSASKFALVGFFHCLRAEEEKSGVYITMVYPGFIKTNISKNALTGDGKAAGKMDAVIEAGIAVEICANRTLRSIANREREVVIAGIKERFGLWMQKHIPNLFFKMIQTAKVR
ncbi:SDR family NAD(P)-dependent oxidoreductase [Leptospira sp. 96542]|nr:SDR family NAD(P)-dependent oxidoreductase [Leptospira sp. 96542]